MELLNAFTKFFYMESFKKKKGIVAGAFDIIHPGYIQLFKFAKKNCNEFTIAIHDNPKIERPDKIKPFHSMSERKIILRSIKYIDKIKVYKSEKDLYKILNNDNYDIRFLDETYKKVKYTGHDLPIKIKWIPRKHNYSYTRLINLIRNV